MTFVKQKNLDSAVVGTQHTSTYVNRLSDTDFYNGGNLESDSLRNKEYQWDFEWEKWHKYYVDVPIFAAIIDTIATYATGKGYKADEKNDEKIKKIIGWGKDDFNSIIENLTRVCLLAGDSTGEIIKDKAKRLTNLKPLNLGSMSVIVNASGIISRYEQKLNSGETPTEFDPKEIFHLCWGRLGDETHGKPYAERVETIIKQIKQLTEDLGLRFHRIIKPVRLYEAETDDEAKLTASEVKLKNGWENCEVIVIPKGTLEAKDVAKIPDAMDAISYLNNLMRQLISACGVPEVILGWSEGSTDASSKIVYLSFQQRIERIQLFLEQQIKAQLGVELNFEFPASLEPAISPAGEGVTPPKNNPPVDDSKQEGKINNIMKK